MERLFHFMKLEFDLENIKGPLLPKKWVDISKKKREKILWNKNRKKVGKYWRKNRCVYCKKDNIENLKDHRKECKKYLKNKLKSVRYSHKKITKTIKKSKTF